MADREPRTTTADRIWLKHGGGGSVTIGAGPKYRTVSGPILVLEVEKCGQRVTVLLTVEECGQLAAAASRWTTFPESGGR